jgi:hypothetical protein
VTKRFLIVAEIEIEVDENYIAEEAASYITGVLNHLQPEDKLIDLSAYELT